MTRMIDDVSAEHDRAVVFVSDRGFVVPTLLAATQAKAQAKGIADVYVVLIGLDGADAAIVKAYCVQHGILIRRIADVALDEQVAFAATHVPPSCLGRFLITSVLPNTVKHIIYIDGDVQIVGDITPLLRHTVAAGYIAAANDQYWLGSFGRKKRQEAYLGGLQVTASNYFNSGVLAFRRDTWDQYAPRALEFFKNNSRLCRFHDQSALNVIFNGRREEISPNYNFTSAYSMLAGIDLKSVKLIHFTGGNKPWYYDGAPWNGRFIAQYEDLLEANPDLVRFWSRPSDDQIRTSKKHDKRQRLAYRILGLTVTRGMRLRRYLKRRAFAF